MTTITALAGRAAPGPFLATALAATGAPAGQATRTGGAGKAAAGGTAVLAPRAGTATAAAKARTSRASTAARSAARKPASKATAKKAGYATSTSLPAEFAFLRDPRLSLDEKLSRFIGILMTRADQDLLAQMEKMAPGAKAKASGGTQAGGASAPKKKRKGGLWGAVKLIMPAVGMASSVLGEAATKKLVQQLGGPALAAAAAALGMPQLAPLALKAGATLGALVTDSAKGELGEVASAIGTLAEAAGTGAFSAAGVAGGGVTATAASATGATAGGGATGGTGAAAGGSEKADQLELQRLMERQKETFTLLSNILRANHEARMASIQNIR